MVAEHGGIVRIVCVDDNAMVTDALAVRLGMEPWLRVVKVLPQADGLVREAARASADVVLLDLDMPGKDAFEAMSELSLHRPEARCIVVSGFMSNELVDRAVGSGAWGYVHKTAGADAVVEAIRGVWEGRFVLPVDRASPEGQS